jgi:hypothetical protein
MLGKLTTPAGYLQFTVLTVRVSVSTTCLQLSLGIPIVTYSQAVNLHQ